MHKTRNVTFNVPAGENYQSDSISAFSGIHITDNPLLADSSSASDMLNLYLTTENTLSTRPRLEFIKKHGLNIKQMISVWKVSEDQILYHYVDSNNTIHLDINNQTIDLNNNDVGSNKIRCFKKNDKIYILSEKGYFVIKSDNKLYNVINDEDTYIPTTKIVDSSGASTEVDKLNSLSNKYKVLYNWDGNASLYGSYDNTQKLVSNDYYSKKLIDNGSITILASSNNGCFVYQLNETKEIIYLNNLGDKINLTTKYSLDNTKTLINLSSDGSKLTQIIDSTHIKLINLSVDSDVYNLELTGEDVLPLRDANLGTKRICGVSNDGFYVWVPIDSTSESGSCGFGCFVRTNSSYTYYKEYMPERSKFNEPPTVIYDEVNKRCVSYNIDYFLITFDVKINITIKNGESGLGEPVNCSLSGDGNVFGFSVNNASNSTIYKINLTEENDYKSKSYTPNEFVSSFDFNIDGSCVIYTQYSNSDVSRLQQYDFDNNIEINLLNFEKVINVKISNSNLLLSYSNKSAYQTIEYVYTSSIEPKLSYSYDVINETKKDYLEKDLQPVREDNDRIIWNLAEYLTNNNTPYKITIYSTYKNTTNPNTNLTFSKVTLEFTKVDNQWTLPSETLSPGTYGDITLNFSGVSLFATPLYSDAPDIRDVTFEVTIYYENKESFNDGKTFTNQIQFYNNYWLSYKNKLYNTQYNDPTYIPESNVSVIGDDTDITGFNLIGNNAMCVYKRNKQFVITASEVDDVIAYSKTEMKTDKGNIPFGETILSAQKNYPLQFDDEGIYVLQIPENINTTENAAVCVSERINGKFIGEPHKENILTHNHLYWTYIMIPSKAETKIYIWDSRNNGWYYWTIPIKVVGSWETLKTYDYVENSDGETIGIFDHDDDWTYQIDEYVGTTNGVDEYQKVEYKRSNPYDYTEKQYTETVLIDDTGCVYNLKVIDYIDTRITGVFKDRGTQFLDIIYRDDDLQYLPISWKWESQIMPMSYTKYNKAYSAINYTKQLVQTGFMFVDSDRTEEYSLNFKFIPYRKKIDENKKDKPIDGTLNYIRSVVKRTRVPKFNFLKIILTDDNKYDKLNLISLKFKYKLMEEKLS